MMLSWPHGEKVTFKSPQPRWKIHFLTSCVSSIICLEKETECSLLKL